MKTQPKDYSGLFENVLKKAGENRPLSMELASLEPDLETACRLEGSQLRLFLRTSRVADHPDLLARVLDRSFALRNEDPAEAQRLAEVGVEIASALRLPRPLRRLAADCRSQAWANLANLLRASEDFPGAERAIRRAARWCQLGSGDPLIEGQGLWSEGALRRAQHRFAEAKDCLLRASDLYRSAEEPLRAGEIQVTLANTLYAAGEDLPACEAIREATILLAEHADLELTLTLTHNATLYHEAAGKLRGALLMMEQARWLYRVVGSALLTLRGQWLQGRLFSRVGALEKAAHALEEVRCGFLARHLRYEAALASLDLALVYARQGKYLKVRGLAAEMYPVFIAQEIPREASAALILFAEATEDWRADVTAIEAVLAQLKPLRRASGH